MSLFCVQKSKTNHTLNLYTGEHTFIKNKYINKNAYNIHFLKLTHAALHNMDTSLCNTC